MKKGKIVVLTLSGLLVLSSAVIVPSVLKNKHLFNVAGEESSPCKLTFNKNSIIFNDDDAEVHYIQQGTLRLKTNKVHLDEKTHELIIDQGGSIETTGEAYDASKGYGSVANGISEIKIAPHDPSQKLNMFLAYTEPNDSYWRALGQANSYVFQKGQQYPPRYFKFTAPADQDVQLDSFTIFCTASEKMFPNLEGMPYIEEHTFKNAEFYATLNYVSSGEPIKFDLKIDVENEKVNYYRCDPDEGIIATTLKPYGVADDGNNWLLVDEKEIDKEEIKFVYTLSMGCGDGEIYANLMWNNGADSSYACVSEEITPSEEA